MSPFRLDLTAWVLRRRLRNEIDVWDEDTSRYQRSLVLEHGPVFVSVSQSGSTEESTIRAEVFGDLASESTLSEITAALTRNLGLHRDLSGFMKSASRDPDLGPIAKRMRGVKPPRFASVFEALVNGVACQQLSLDVGIHLLNRLARKYGLPVPGVEGAPPTFPGPEELAGIEPEEIRGLGFSFAKARTIVEASRAIVTGELDLEGLTDLEDEFAYRELTAVRGVGRWTAEYVLLRGLGRIHVFPGDDVGAHNKLKSLMGLEPELTYDRVQGLVARWEPYAGLVYFHLLLDSIDREWGLGL